MEGFIDVDNERLGAFHHAPSLLSAAHELKSPLALVRQLALDLERGEMTTSEIRQAAERVVLTAERALRLTTDLTKYARLEDNLFGLEPLNALSLCEDVVHELRPLYQAKQRTLKINRKRRVPLAIANRDLLRRIMINFVDNALHYSAETVRIDVHTRCDGEYVRLSVRDFGPAVPSDLWKRLKFSLGNGRQAIQSRPESSGLGMYVAGQFAEAMQATIGAKRHRDGVTFYIDLHTSHQLRLL